MASFNGTSVRCPYCKTTFKAEGSMDKVTCKNCGGIYKVKFREVTPHMQKEMGDRKWTCHVSPLLDMKKARVHQKRCQAEE